MTARWISIAMALALLGPQDAGGHAATVLGSMSEMHQAILNVASGDERARVSDVEFTLGCAHGAPGLAVAIKDGSRRMVCVSEDFVLGLLTYITALQMEQQLARPGLARSYVQYSLRGLDYEGFKPDTLEKFARLTKDEEARFSKWDDSSGRIHVLFTSSLYYILAHELGHHALDRYGVRERPDITLDDEKRCDRWASRQLSKVGVDPALAIPAMMYLFEIESYSFAVDRTQTHPHALSRGVALANDSIAAPRADDRAYVELRAQIERYRSEHERLDAASWKELLDASNEALAAAVQDVKAAIAAGDGDSERRGRMRVSHYRQVGGEAALFLGRFYQTGYGGVRIDLKEALGYFLISHVSGNDWGSMWAATSLAEGWGAERDVDQALLVIERAARGKFLPGIALRKQLLARR